MTNSLKIYNSLTRSKEVFTPLQAGKVSMYVCGITVYDYCHLGHARSMVAFDVIVRYLRAKGYDVTYVRNITDIDDKIINRANERGIGVDALTAEFIEAMEIDERALAILEPDIQPKATDNVDAIIRLIQRLLDKGIAYQASNGDINYEVAKFAGYGKLAHKDIDGLEAGNRVAVDDAKRSPLDFVLWKQAKPDEPSWPSPWGNGRPGWHIECSAMSMENLGETFDIHGGGFDLQFPHHENEIAQSEAATGKTFANYWMHAGFLQINQEKMSKSLGNFFTIRDALTHFHPETLRFFLLSSHYRSQLNFSNDNIQSAGKSLERLYQCLANFELTGEEQLSQDWIDQFHQAMDDDFNTPDAMAVMFTLSHEVNKTGSVELAATCKHLGSILGILQSEPSEFLRAGVGEDQSAQIESLIAERNQARAQKDWAKADAVRQQLTDMGIVLEDGAEGTTWRKA